MLARTVRNSPENDHFFASGLYKLPQFHFHPVQLSGTLVVGLPFYSLSSMVFFSLSLVTSVLCARAGYIFARGSELIYQRAIFIGQRQNLNICRFVGTFQHFLCRMRWLERCRFFRNVFSKYTIISAYFCVTNKLHQNWVCAASIGTLYACDIDRPLTMFASRRSYNDANSYNCSVILRLIALARSS